MSDEAKTVSLEEFNRIKTAHENALGKLTTVEKEMEKFKGFDPEAYKATKEELEILRRDNAAGDPKKIDELVAKARKEAEEESRKRFSDSLTERENKLKEKDGALSEVQKELKNLRVIKTAMTKAAAIFTDTEQDLVQAAIEASCDWGENDIIVKGKDGKPRASKKDPNKDMGIDEFLEEFAAAHPSITKSKATGGTMKNGTTTSGVPKGEITLEVYRGMSNADRAKLEPSLRYKLSQLNLSSKPS